MYSGLSVAEVTSSPEMVEAALNETALFWSVERELLAQILELIHVLVLTTQSAYGGKNLPKPIHVERPFERAGAQRRPPAASASAAGGRNAPVIRMSEFVKRTQQGVI